MTLICYCKQDCVPPWPAWRTWRSKGERWDCCRTWSSRYQMIGIVGNVVGICSQGKQKVTAQFLFANSTAMCTKLPLLTFFWAPQVTRQQVSTMRHQLVRPVEGGRSIRAVGITYVGKSNEVSSCSWTISISKGLSKLHQCFNGNARYIEKTEAKSNGQGAAGYVHTTVVMRPTIEFTTLYDDSAHRRNIFFK